MDDVDYLVEDNTTDDFRLSSRMEGNMVGWHNDGASWEQNANARNDYSNWGETQQQKVIPLLEWL